MSAKAMGDAFDNSPLRGCERIVHLAIADVVNDVHGYRLWMKRSELATKAKVSRGTVDATLRRMLENGWLSIVTEGGGRGNATEYRYHLGGKPRTQEAVCAADTPGVTAQAQGDTAQSVTDTAQSGDSSPLIELKELKEPKDLAPVRRDEVFETVAEVCGMDWHHLTGSARGSLNKAVSEIRLVGGTPEEIRRKAAEYRARMPDMALTAPALAKWWPSLNGDPNTVGGKNGNLLRAAARIMAEENQ